MKINYGFYILCVFLVSADKPVAAENSLLTVNPAALRPQVEKIVKDYPQRDFQHPKVLKSLAEYLLSQFDSDSSEVRLQKFRVEGNDYYNVVARFGPKTKKRIIIGAHYDVAGGFPGADDNASGVVGLLELSKLLRHLSARIFARNYPSLPF